MVNAGGHLGALGRAYLNREIRSWDDVYENGPRPASQHDDELLDMHARPRPEAPAFSDGWASIRARHPGPRRPGAGPGRDRLRHGLRPVQRRLRLRPARPGSRRTGRKTGHRPLRAPWEYQPRPVAAEIGDWDASIILDLASDLADGTEPPGFWAAAAGARAEKGAGRYGAAAASWTLARDQLPSGHLMRDGLDSLISALRTASGTGQHVTRRGYIVHHSTEPPSPWSAGQLVEAVRNHAAGLGDDKQALRKVLDGWTDGAIAAAFDAAREPGEAVARACLFATFERAEPLALNTWQAARAVTEAIRTARQSPEAAGIKVSEDPGHPLVYDLRIPCAIASALSLGAGANEFAAERIGRMTDIAGCVTILQAEAGKDFTTVTIRLDSAAPAADSPAPAAAGFPCPPRPATAGKAPGPASSRAGQQVPPRTRGRAW